MVEPLRWLKANRCRQGLYFAFMFREGHLSMSPRGWSVWQGAGPERFDDTGENPSGAPRKSLKGE